MATIATLAVSLTARTNRFNRRMRRARGNVNRFSSSIWRSSRRMVKWGSVLMGIAAGGGLTLLMRRAFMTADSLAKTADKLGIGTEALAGFHHAAKLSGIETRTFDMALQRVTRRISEAAHGTGEAKDAIKELGLDAVALAAKSGEERFYAVVDALDRVKDSGDLVRLAFKLFDSEGVAVINMLKKGSAGLREWRRDAESLGLTMTRLDLGVIEGANDSLFRLRQLFHGVALAIARHIAPTVTHFANEIVYAATAGNDLGATVSNAFDTIGGAIGRVINQVLYFRAGLAKVRAEFLQLVLGLFEWPKSVLDKAYANPIWRTLLGLRRIPGGRPAGIETELAGLRLAIAEYEKEAERLAGLAATGAGETWVTEFFKSIALEAKRNAGGLRDVLGDLPGLDGAKAGRSLLGRQVSRRLDYFLTGPAAGAAAPAPQLQPQKVTNPTFVEIRDEIRRLRREMAKAAVTS